LIPPNGGGVNGPRPPGGGALLGGKAMLGVVPISAGLLVGEETVPDRCAELDVGRGAARAGEADRG
jgi:hypothetical protein